MPADLHTPARPILLLCATTALGVTLAGCKVENRPLLARDTAPAYSQAAPVDYAYAPGASSLPYAQPAQVAPAGDLYDGYALAERAYAYDRAVYRAPPESGFRYGDVEPWAWQTANDDLMFAEPVDDGYRFYYYEPGETRPYFVRDAQNGYAYGDNGVLTALFDAAGALLPQDRLYGSADVAGRYLARGYDLRQVYQREPHIAVAEPLWTRRAPLLAAARDPWIAAAERQPTWREYRVSTGERQLRAFDTERARREDRAAFAVPVGPPPHAVARGLRQRADSVFDHAAPVVAREPRYETKDWAKAQRHEAKDWAKAERHEAKDWAKAQRQEAKADRREGRQVARNEAPAAAANWTAGEHGRGGGKHEGRGGDDRGGGKHDGGGGDHHGGGKGGDHGGGHGGGKH